MEPDSSDDHWLCEALNPNVRVCCRGGVLLEAGASRHQSYEVWDTPQFGKLYRLDGSGMASEADEFFYHENLIHFATIAQVAPRRALILGGGDGGSARELFRHPGIEQVVLVELDAKVIDLARTHLAAIHRGALDDSRLELRIDDGLHYVREIARRGGETFDLIVFDLTEPDGPAAALYGPEFLSDCKNLLSGQGALSLQLGAPVFQPGRVRELVGRLRAVFRHVQPYFFYVPLYGSLWGMACASDRLRPGLLSAREVDRRLVERSIAPLRYYNGAIHRAQLALPKYLRALLDAPGRDARPPVDKIHNP
jgi:spermidine synthase